MSSTLIKATLDLRGLDTASSPNFTFNAGPKLIFSRGDAASNIRSTLSSMSLKNPLLVTGKSGVERFGSVFQKSLGNDFVLYTIGNEPTVEDCLAAVKTATDNNCDSVVAIGGGSALDLGKASSALMTNNHRDIYDFLEVIGKGQPLENDPVPFIAVPTTSGTGSEVTKNAVIKSVKFGRKVSIRHEKMYPVAAIIDPTLTLSCPQTLTANVGMDALCQIIEPFTSNAVNPFVDGLAREGIIRAARSIRVAVNEGKSGKALKAREDMAIASVLGGICLANAKLGVVHGFAGVLGGMYDNAAHGAICATLLPACFKRNVEKLSAAVKAINNVDSEEYIRYSAHLSRFTEVSCLLTGNSKASPFDGVQWLQDLLTDIKIPRLKDVCKDISNNDFDVIISNTLEASSTKGNPIKLTKEDLLDILNEAM